jgi:hypothetical protein
MTPLETDYLIRCISSLEKAYTLLQKHPDSSLEYELFRSASIKEFELVLEQSGKLLKKILNPFFILQKQWMPYPLRTFLGMPLNIQLSQQRHAKDGWFIETTEIQLHMIMVLVLQKKH